MDMKMEQKVLLHNIRLISRGFPIEFADGDAETLYDVLTEHQCLYLINCIKPESRVKFMPHRAVLVHNKASIKERYARCERIFRALDDSHITYAVYKGAVLSTAAYEEPFYRASSDIDLFVRKVDVQMVKSMFSSFGFVQGRVSHYGTIVPYSREELIFHSSKTHQLAPFIYKTDSSVCPYINIDINFNVMWGESDTPSDMDYILENVEESDIYGVKINKLSPVIDFIAVCLHHYKDANSLYLLYNGSLKLYLYSDIYYYLKNNAYQVTPDDLYRECEALHVTPFVYHCVYYAYTIFNDDILLPYLEILESSEGMYLLDKFGLNEKERKKWDSSLTDRLFSDLDFTKYLDENDIEKIKMNVNMMG